MQASKKGRSRRSSTSQRLANLVSTNPAALSGWGEEKWIGDRLYYYWRWWDGKRKRSKYLGAAKL